MSLKKTLKFDFVIVGGGIVGLACAYKLQLNKPHLKIAVLEKEPSLATHQTGRNSGVIHSGLYYKPGSFRAKNCVNGRVQLVEFAKKYNIKHDVCGKIVVACSEDELPRLDQIYKRGLENGLDGIKKIDSSEIKKIEPFVEGIEALFVPQSGIIDFVGVTIQLAKLIVEINPNSQIFTSCEVIDFSDNIINTSLGCFESSYKICCAGLFSDRIAKKDALKPEVRIVGFRGDYFDLTEAGKVKVNHLIYPVPNPEFPFLGVHFTRMTDGSIECGPNAVFTFKREGYKKTDFNFRDTFEALLYIGTWRLFFKHWKFGLKEYRRAFSKRLFLNELKRMIPSLEMSDIVEGRSGVRAMALANDGDVFDDFKIEYIKNSIHVLNAPSPAATACLAIGDEVLKVVNQKFRI